MNAALPPLREVIARHELGAKKSLGQHFLLDLNITRKIARVAEIAPGDRVLEVGPGPGGLTRALLEAGADVVAVERDARCIAALAELATASCGKLTLIEDDALRFDERTIAGDAPLKIVANLPYNISTALLIKWLRTNHRRVHQAEGGSTILRQGGASASLDAPYKSSLWRLMALMFQKEVADRILAAPGSKTFGRLSVIAQAAARPERAFDLPARAFTPPPKVDSTVVLLRPAAPLENFEALERVTQAAFGQRRKMLRSSMKALWGADTEAILLANGIAPTDRAEDISVDLYKNLAENCRDFTTP